MMASGGIFLNQEAIFRSKKFFFISKATSCDTLALGIPADFWILPPSFQPRTRNPLRLVLRCRRRCCTSRLQLTGVDSEMCR